MKLIRLFQFQVATTGVLVKVTDPNLVFLGKDSTTLERKATLEESLLKQSLHSARGRGEKKNQGTGQHVLSDYNGKSVTETEKERHIVKDVNAGSGCKVTFHHHHNCK